MLEQKDKIILTGVNGFIGSFLFKKFKNNCSITAMGYTQRLFESDYTSLDLTDKVEVLNFAENAPKCDVLIFLVGLAHKKGKRRDLDEFRNVNKQTLINLLISLDKNNKLPAKIIFASTISVYGEKMHQNIYYEDSSKNPFSPYSITKLEAEEYLLNKYSTQSWILRFAPVYGPDFQLNIKRRTKVGNRFYKIGDGTKKVSLCNLENIGLVVKGILEDKIPAGVYNISDQNEYSYNDLLKYVNAKWIFRVPDILVKVVYVLSKILNHIFLKENAIKLISDNTFPSDKIRVYIDLPAVLANSIDSLENSDIASEE